MAKRIITEADILAAAARGENKLAAHPGTDIVTPQARDTALAMGVVLDGDQDGSCPPGADCPGDSVASRPSSPPHAASPSANGLRGGNPAGVSGLAIQIAEALRGKIPAGVDSKQLERLVREAVSARMGGPATNGQDKAVSCAGDCGVIFIDSARLLAENAPTSRMREKSILADAFGRAGESKLAAGYLVCEKGSLERVVEAPEVCVVIEGELRLTAGGETIVGKPGDMLYLPQGAKVVYSTPSRVKLACVGRQG